MIAEFDGIKVKIPRGYTPIGNGIYMDGHGVEYGLVQYGRDKDDPIYLEAISDRYDRRVPVKRVKD